MLTTKPNIHLVMLFSRLDLLQVLIECYRPMGIVLHLVRFKNEFLIVSPESWVIPFVIPKDVTHNQLLIWGNNYFFQHATLIDEDYYVLTADDDMYEDGVFDRIKECTEDVIIISMKRGYKIPNDKRNRHGTDTLIACPENMRVRKVGAEQMFFKGRIIKNHSYIEDNTCADGILAKVLKAKYEIRYEPDLFALFNYFQPGRYNREE